MTSKSHPSVVVLVGAEAGTVLQIDEVLNDFVVGSAEGCHLLLSGTGISPMHAALFLDDEGQIVLTDTKSLTGVFVNGTKVTEHLLSNGDEICIGPPGDPQSSRLRFVAKGADMPVVEAPADLAELEGLRDLQPSSVEDFAFAPLEAAGLQPGGDLSAAPAEWAPAPVEELPAFEEFPPLEAQSPSEPDFLPQPAPVVEPPPASRPRRPRAATNEDADDPLAGLAESLGGDDAERFVPPPVAEVLKAPAAAKRAGASPLVMAARLTVVALVCSGLAWLGLQKYSASIMVPVVDTYMPNPVEPGQILTINGSGFGENPDPTTVKVMLGSTEAQVLDATPTRLNITVPESIGAAGSQTLSVKVEVAGANSTGRLLKTTVIPKIVELSPRVALSGDEVAINGRWLANEKTKPLVTVAGRDAEVLEATSSRLRIRVPSVTAAEGQRVSVRVAVGAEVGKEALLNHGRLPFIEVMSPERSLPGEIVTLTGLGLSGPDLSISVGSRSAAVLSATDTEVKFSLPGLRLSENAGGRGLIVKANGKTSVPNSIEVLRESAGLYSPRFFVELYGGSRAAISCDLGPVMVLGADPQSMKRAHEAAIRLNALSRGGRTERVQFTANDVTINAPGGKVLAVASGDASTNSFALAGLWAAHLTDMFDLFLQGRRPGRVVELSPDGKVFLDIFAAARRRSAEPGVSQGLLVSPDPAWVKSLTSLAVDPVMGSGQALGLVDGLWAGVIEAGGATLPRKVEISLSVTPSGLVGQSTSRQGGLSSDVTLSNLSFVRRELRFSFADSGEDLAFKGRLDGDLIEGAVTKPSGAPVGKLTLKLAR